MIIKLVQCVLVSYTFLDVGISHIEKDNKPKAFYYFVMWFLYLITVVIV